MSERCIDCDAEGIITVMVNERFQYGVDGPDAVMLEVLLPVRCCPSCDTQWTDWEAEEIRDAAIIAHRKAQDATR